MTHPIVEAVVEWTRDRDDVLFVADTAEAARAVRERFVREIVAEVLRLARDDERAHFAASHAVYQRDAYRAGIDALRKEIEE